MYIKHKKCKRRKREKNTASAPLVQAPVDRLALDIALAVHRALGADPSAAAKLANRVADQINHVLRADFEIDIAVDPFARDAKLARLVHANGLLLLQRAHVRPARRQLAVLEHAHHLLAVADERRRVARLVLNGRVAAVVVPGVGVARVVLGGVAARAPGDARAVRAAHRHPDEARRRHVVLHQALERVGVVGVGRLAAVLAAVG